MCIVLFACYRGWIQKNKIRPVYCKAKERLNTLSESNIQTVHDDFNKALSLNNQNEWMTCTYTNYL